MGEQTAAYNKVLPSFKTDMKLLKLFAVCIVYCQHVLSQCSLECQQLYISLM